MRTLTLTAALLLGTSLNAPVLANDHLRIVDEPLELTIQMNHARYPTYKEDWPVEQAAREMTGIHLVDDTVGANMRTDENTGKTEALNLMLAGGVIPDIVGSSRLKDFVNQYGPEGAFIPLNDLIEEHAPHMRAYFAERPEIKAAISAADGNMYYIPYLPDGKYGRAYFIRYDWLDALGLEVPQTVEEVENVLIAFRDQDPNGNGLKDEVPYFARQWPELIRLVTLWDGRSSGSDTYHDFYVDDGQIKHPYAGEGYREGIKNLARWYAEGLIDAEVFTRGSSAREFLLSENMGGMTHDWFASTSGYNSSLAEKVEGFEFKAFAPPASISGVR
ncbi:MAG: sugar ABC transporter permease, partial [Pseudomonadota bacterium]